MAYTIPLGVKHSGVYNRLYGLVYIVGYMAYILSLMLRLYGGYTIVRQCVVYCLYIVHIETIKNIISIVDIERSMRSIGTERFEFSKISERFIMSEHSEE